MTDVQESFSFDDMSWDSTITTAKLPAYVPQVDTKELGELNADLDWPVFAVGLRRVFSPVSWKILPGYQGRSASESLGLAAGVTTVLVGYGEDPLVEAFWTRRHEVYPQLVAQQWGLVLSCNYSMYGNQPRTEHLLNFRRNLQIAVEMRSEGIAAVPNLYWLRLEDLKRHVDWVVDEDVDAVAINLQTFRTDDDWRKRAVPGLLWLGATLPKQTRVIITGSSRVDRISVLGQVFGERLSLVGGNAMMYARNGAVMTEQGRDNVGARTKDAFAHNVRFYDQLVAKHRRSS